MPPGTTVSEAGREPARGRAVMQQGPGHQLLHDIGEELLGGAVQPRPGKRVPAPVWKGLHSDASTKGTDAPQEPKSGGPVLGSEPLATKELQHRHAKIACHELMGRQGGGKEWQRILSAAKHHVVGRFGCHKTSVIPKGSTRGSKE